MDMAGHLCTTTSPSQIPNGHSFHAPGGSDSALALVQEAAARFQDTPMPLGVCLALRHWLGEQSPQEDLLAKAFQAAAPQQPGLRTTELQSLIPAESLGGWALCADTIDYLIERILLERPASLLEFGSGTSSLALAWAMKRLHGSSNRIYLYSIDQSATYIQKAKDLLAQHGLLRHVRFLQADLVDQRIGSVNTTCYHLPAAVLQSFFENAQPDCVVIDGPAGDNGVRFGTIPLVRPHLSSHASLFLDDGLRDSELETADQWERLRYVRWDGMRWTGKGLLCGTVLPVPTEPARQWLEEAHRTIPRRRLFEPTLPVQDARRMNRVEPSRPMPAQLPTETSDRVASAASHPSPHLIGHCVFLNTYYPGFLEEHYQRHPELARASYHEQHYSLQHACFGDSDFYSLGMRDAGWEASDLIVNCRPLQKQWAVEHGLGPNHELLGIALDQIKELRPQVLYLQDLGLATKEFLLAVRPFTELIVGQIASPLPPHAHLDGIDILISSFPHFVEEFRQQGRTAYYQPLAFDPRILKRLGHPSRRYPLTFVGGLSPAHKERQALLASIGQTLPIHYWGYGTQILEQQGVSRDRLHGDVWGADMFAILAESVMTLNQHTDVAKNNANNMRLFEATGCGALLVTDYKDNLNDLFDIGSEIVAYRSPGECRELIEYYLSHSDEASAIAARGQARTLRDHTYQLRMCQTGEVLARHLDKKHAIHRLPPPDLEHISYGYTALREQDITPALEESWRSEVIPPKQRSLVERELSDMYRGHPPVVFRILAEAMQPHVWPGIEVLEVGCASGYYYEALEYLLNTKLSYVGVDFSGAMIRLARQYYPGTQFEIGDGSALRFNSRSIPIVISSCVLLHVQHYALHIAEAARVASEIVILHRTPVSRRTPTQHFKKFAYGIETHEVRLNEPELLGLCTGAGLELVTALTYDEHPEQDEFETTYVFRTSHAAS